MKKVIIISVFIMIIVIVLGMVGWNMVMSKLDDVVKDIDHEVALNQMCDGNQECLKAIEEFYPVCKSTEAPKNSKEFFMQVHPILTCLSEKSQVDFMQFIQ